MIDFINTWNQDYIIYSILRTLYNYRETKKIFTKGLSVATIERLTGGGTCLSQGIRVLMDRGYVIEQDGLVTVADRLTALPIYGLLIEMMAMKPDSQAETRKNIDPFIKTLNKADGQLLGETLEMEGVFLAPMMEFLSAMTEARLNKTIKSLKYGQVRTLLQARNLLDTDQDKDRWNCEAAELVTYYQNCSYILLADELIPAFLRKTSRTVKDHLADRVLGVIEEAAAFGYFHQNKAIEEPSELNALPAVFFRPIEKRPYALRRTMASDIDILLELETLCWPAGLEIRGEKLVNRISRFPYGQWVALIDGQVVGAVYSQRINDPDDLLSTNMDEVEQLFDAKGKVVQLLAVNVHPSVQDLQIGGGLLEYVLQRVPLTAGIERVVGVTRCRSYQKFKTTGYDDYVKLRGDNGSLKDPVLRYHELHGATIVQPLPNYRERDAENEGYGVLVSYDIYNRVRKDVQLASADVANELPVADLVIETIQKLLGDAFEDRYSGDLPLMEIGLDSSDLMVLRETLEGALDTTISASFFFENSTADLVIEALMELAEEEAQVATVVKPSTELPKAEAAHRDNQVDEGDIAIVSYSFRFPNAGNKAELWELLVNQESAITSLPGERFEWPDWVDVRDSHKGIDLGGYLEDIDKFDAGFFRITPAEAELMDPQQRILLELCWEAIEMANEKPSALKGSKTGVFIGASGSDYELLLRENKGQENMTGTGTALALLPNRLSYFYDFNGPSMQIDTACSSSLVAIHEAVKAIRAGECSQAFAGAVNMICHPSRNLSYYQAQMLSRDGKCQTFDEKANGYVRGEGAAILWLKPLKEAIEAGDRVHGIVKGTAVNHGGQAGGLTVPNPKRQQQLVIAAHQKANTDIHALSYMEAHGTGTGLGDPIEIDGLKKAFNSLKTRELAAESCGIGSVKTNLGHLEAAAGMAGVIKVLLSMEKEQLPPTNNFNRLNPKIDLQGSPFRIQTKLTPWQPNDGAKNLLAGVSSFGIGGANGHVVLQNFYHNPENPAPAKAEEVVITLSAQSEDRLHAYASSLLTYLEQHDTVSLTALAKVFQLGRASMNTRLALVVKTIKALKTQLEGFSNGDIKCTRLKSGGAKKETLSQAKTEESTPAQLAAAWLKGTIVDWSLRYDSKATLQGVPTYPFLKERHWLATGQAAEKTAKIHPLVQQNVSTLAAQQFQSSFSGHEYFLQDHVVYGRKMLPGAAYLEMIIKAGGLSTGNTVNTISNLNWVNPIVVNGVAKSVNIQIAPGAESDAFTIYSPGEDAIVFGEGDFRAEAMERPNAVKIDQLTSRFDQKIDGNTAYQKLKSGGFEYGTTFQGIQELYLSDIEALAKVRFDSANTDLTYKPEILDCAFQATMLLPGVLDQRMIPYSVDQIKVYQEPGNNVWCYVKRVGDVQGAPNICQCDIDIYDEEGQLAIQVSGYNAITAKGEDAGYQTNLYEIGWEPTELLPVENEEKEQLYYLWDFNEDQSKELADLLDQVVEIVPALSPEKLVVWLLEQSQSLLAKKEKVQVNFIYPLSEQLACSWLAGYFKTLNNESHLVSGKMIGFERSTENAIEELAELLEKEIVSAGVDVRYQAGKRLEKRPLPLATEKNNVLDLGKRILISGGAGGIGKVITSNILNETDAEVIVLGRRGQDAIDMPGHSRLSYYQCDISNLLELSNTYRQLVAEQGQPDGIFHCAGVIADDFIKNKTEEQVQSVFAAKVTGAQNLDSVTADAELKSFTLFSSLTGLRGNAGQADYAAANNYLDEFATYRNQLVAQGQRRGQTLSINWPLWDDLGMTVSEEGKKQLETNWGVKPLPVVEGISALSALIGVNCAQVAVAYELNQSFARKFAHLQKKKRPTVSTDASYTDEEVLTYVRDLVATELKMSAEKLEDDVHFQAYGIDSILINKLTNRLDTLFGKLPRTLFFEYQTLEELADYFKEEHSDSLKQLLNVEAAAEQTVQTDTVATSAVMRTGQRFANDRAALPAQALQQDEIAIIGLSGKFPGADNIEQFWDVLAQGKDCITQVPAERWDAEEIYDPEIGKDGKVYSKWGGFINDVDKFDPTFFKISPRDAELMDPQERLFLQTAWETIEDAGYTKDRLIGPKIKGELGGNVGVFAGVMYEEYQLFGAEQTLLGNPMAMWTSPSSIANRVSHFFDFHGPSMTIDTMCSSSLTAIHLACESLKRGETDYALAGGVNVTIHPNKYRMLSKGRFMSAKGRCESFGEGGEGYVPAEGVGAVLLKPLQKAITDGDRIYGVVKGTSVNHGGITNGYTVPNPNAQSAVIKKSIERAGIAPDDFSYIEAHGTGTSLGDPIEIRGLSKAFATDKKQFCAIGSVKSNIGHGESAAGISGVAKVLLQLKHQKLVPSIHSATLNQNIDFENSPFVVQQELADWQQPDEKSRIAGISSFGAGGSNAHMIIEEFDRSAVAVKFDQPAVIVLSARNKERLAVVVEQLKSFLESQQAIELHDIAHTLQYGREAMKERIATVVASKRELIQKLSQFAAGNGDWYRGTVRPGMMADSSVMSVEELIAGTRYSEIAEAWTNGHSIDWLRLYPDAKPHRISLPTYPFLKKRFWYDGSTEVTVAPKKAPVPVKAVSSPVTAKPAEQVKPISKPKTSLELKFNLDKPEVVAKKLAKADRSFDYPSVKLTPTEDIATPETEITTEKVQPQVLQPIEEIKTPNQKEPSGQEPSGQELSVRPDIMVTLRNMLAKALYLETSDIDDDEKFVDLGLDSVVGVEWVSHINDHFQIELAATRLYDFPTINLLSKHLAELMGTQVATETKMVAVAKPKPTKPAANVDSLKEQLIALLAAALYLEPSDVDEDEKFIDLGLDSVVGVELVASINERFSLEINATRLYDFPTVALLAAFIAEEQGGEVAEDAPVIAVVTAPGTPVVTENDGSGDVLAVLRQTLAAALYLDEQDVDIDEKFVDLGLDSVVGVEWTAVINERFPIGLEATRLYDYPTIHLLANYISSILTSISVAPMEARLGKVQPVSAPVAKPATTEAAADQTPSTSPPRATPTGNGEITKKLKELLAAALYLDAAEIDEDEKFVDLGLDSVVGVEWTSAINEQLNVQLEATRLYDYPTLTSLSAHISSLSTSAPITPVVRETAPVVAETTTVQSVLAIEEIKTRLRQSLAEMLYLDEADIDDLEKFVDLGLDSVVGVEWVTSINTTFDTNMEATRLYDYPTIEQLSSIIQQSAAPVTTQVNEETIVEAPGDLDRQLMALLDQVAGGDISVAEADKLILETLNSN